MNYASDRPVSDDEFTIAQNHTIAFLETIGGFREALRHTTVANGLWPMPDQVHTIKTVDGDWYLHPNGSIKSYYSPARHDPIIDHVGE